MRWASEMEGQERSSGRSPGIEYTQLRIERREGVPCVQTEELLHLLEKRVNVILRKCATPGLDPSATELLRGRLIEINELTNALRR